MAQARVIIVEDHREMARQIRRALEREWPELDIVDVPSAEEALLELLRGMPDLFIIDLGLPGLPGHEFIRRIRRVSPSLPILVTTAETPERVEALLQGLSVEGVFYKPFSLKSLTQKVGQLLRLGTDPLTEHLREVQEAFQARAAFIVDADGLLLMAYGHPPGRAEWEAIRGAVLAMLNGGYRLSKILGGTSRNIYLCRNDQHTLLFRDLEGEYWLALLGTVEQAASWSTRLGELDDLADQLKHTLHMRVEGEREAPEMVVEEEEIEVPEVEVKPEEAERFWEQILEEEHLEAEPEPEQQEEEEAEVGLPEVQAEDAERFWEEVLEKSEIKVQDPNALTYEQARSLGLIPEESIPSSDDENA